ncbi:MAG: hypothetical protein IJ990_02440 [Alistipes sp.]|nr:hypothetical protein [Alistipes sp.]
MSEILLIGLNVFVLLLVGYLWMAAHDHLRRRWLRLQHGVLYDAIEQIGISALVVDRCTLQRLDALLAVEYPRYEVILTLRRARDPILFEELLDRFRLIRVEYTPSGELPVAGVVGLYRSRKRRFRRLVLLDIEPRLARNERLNAAADVATYEYLLPIPSGATLRVGAVEGLACAVDRLQGVSFDRLRSWVGLPARLEVRASVVAAGGFRRLPWRLSGRWLPGPIFSSPALWRRWACLLGRLFGVGVLAAVWVADPQAWWQVIAVGITCLWVEMVQIYLRQLARF